MLANHPHRLSFPFLLVVGLLSGCTEPEAPPAEPQTMFPGLPEVALVLDAEPGTSELDCAAECCGIPQSGVALYIVTGNWLLAPHEECGNEPQCGPVVIRMVGSEEHALEIETVESTITIDVQAFYEQNTAREPWPGNWIIAAETLPRPEFGPPRDGRSIYFHMFDEAARLEHDSFVCDFEDERFYVYADISPTTAPGEYVMRAGLDDAEVTCTFAVSTGEGGGAELEYPAVDACTPAGLVGLSIEDIENPDAPAVYRRVRINPREPVARVSLEVSRAGEVVVTGSHEPAGELVPLDGEECTVIPCQIAASWGVTVP